MSPDEFYERELTRLEAEWKNGHFLAVGEAFHLLAGREPQWPEWLIEAVHDSMKFAFENGGAPGQGKTGGHRARADRAAIEEMRWSIAKVCLADRKLGTTRGDAFELASEMLRNSAARGSAGQIKAAFYKHQKRLRNSTEL